MHTRRLLTAVRRPSARSHLQSVMVVAEWRATTSPIRTAAHVEFEEIRHGHPQYRFGGVWCDGCGETRVCEGEDDGEAVLHWCLLRRA